MQQLRGAPGCARAGGAIRGAQGPAEELALDACAVLRRAAAGRGLPTRLLSAATLPASLPPCPPPAGHVFEGEGFANPTDKRHCVNSLSIKYVPDASA